METDEQHPNVTLIMHIWEAFDKNYLEAIGRMVSEDIVYRVSGRGPISGIYKGRLMFIKST